MWGYLSVPANAAAAGAAYANIIQTGDGPRLYIRAIWISVTPTANASTAVASFVGLTRSTARGTQTSTNGMGQASGSDNHYGTQIDYAWSVAPTVNAPPYLARWVLPAQIGALLSLNIPRGGIVVPAASGNGLAFVNFGVATGAQLQISVAVEQ